MDDINLIVAGNLKRLREERKMSLDAVSREAGVSKSMLAQIEKGDVNPSLASVWKIATGLKVPFSELIDKKGEESEVINKDDVHVFLADDGRYKNYPIFGLAEGRRFEMCYVEVDPSGRLEADAHQANVEEFITVFSGKLLVHVNDQELAAGPGCSLRFKAGRPHTYINPSKEVCRFSLVMHYPE